MEALAAAGLAPADVDMVLLSHLHWDHKDRPGDYPDSIYVIGPGSTKLINRDRVRSKGNHSFFDPSPI